MKIRRADVTRGDFKTFGEMLVWFRYAEHNPGDEQEKETVIKDYDDYYEYVQNKCIYFAVHNGKEIGYVIISAFDDKCIKIEEIYVSRNYQRDGYGNKFIKKFVEFLKEAEKERIEARSTTLETDKFWKECNFKPIKGSNLFEYKIK